MEAETEAALTDGVADAEAPSWEASVRMRNDVSLRSVVRSGVVPALGLAKPPFPEAAAGSSTS